MSRSTVGFLGLGSMGDPMVRTLLAKEWTVLIAPRDPAKAARLAAEGATLVADPAVMAEKTSLVVACLPDAEAVREVLFAPRGLVVAGRWDGLFIDCSTLKPAESIEIGTRLAELGSESLDAPISGGPRGATEGTLSIMVGGTRRAVERGQAVMEALGSKVIHCGAAGAGQVTKACNQLIVMSTMTAVAESLSLAASAGVDPAVVREALLGAYAYSPILEMHGPRMLTGDYEPGGRAIFHAKDIATIAGIAAKNGLDLPLFAAARAQYERLFAIPGGPEMDHSAVAILYPVTASGVESP
jgi:2-hydroxy-3-oxopropionate reductase